LCIGKITSESINHIHRGSHARQRMFLEQSTTSRGTFLEQSTISRRAFREPSAISRRMIAEQ
jgi:hypothetical protein